MRVDLLITDVQIYNVYRKQFFRGNAAVWNGRFLYIGDRGLETFDAAQVIDGGGKYMIPGLVDIHLHIESTMVTPQTFSYGLIRNGVTTVVSEPHEMANVFGIEGVLEMIRASEGCVADILYAVPSSVPATPLETTGGSIEIADIDELLKEDKVVCLGEIMNYTEILSGPEGKTNAILRHMKDHHPDCIVEGHVPKLLDFELSQVLAAGVDSDHTHQTPEGMEARIRSGMFLEIQEKSMTPEVMDYLIGHDVAEHFCFVTDDVMTDSFEERGHLNVLVRKAIRMGMTPEQAVYAATFTPARRMRLAERGSIAPNKLADFVLLDDLEEFRIGQVYKNGRKAYDAEEPYVQKEQPKQFPASFYESVKLAPLSEADFTVNAEVEDGSHTCRVMMVSDGTTFTREQLEAVPVRGGVLDWQTSGLGLIATFERYGKGASRAYGLIGGDTIQRGAVATTYSHDNHNLLVVGHNPADMMLAANTVIGQQGGYCVAADGEVLANLRLPVGGILSEEPLHELAAGVKKLTDAMKSLGYKHYSPIMSLSTHSLPVSPALKITDRGLIDVNEGKVVPLIVD